ncbi:MAG: ABC transporter substrate-binding protein [Clostridia bacterium]|nr:ABC transporter substrate-binding protein [Clostridia bacterium]
MKKTKKMLALLMAVTMACTMFMTGCGGGDSSSGGDSNTLVIAIQEEIEGTDIQQIGWENAVHGLLYSPLVTYSEDLSEVLPCFAESYKTSKDGKTITFKIPKDAKFSNGDTLNAESVKKSFDRFLKISEYAGDLGAVESIEATDDTTVVFHLSKAAPYMWANLTSTYGGLVDVDQVEELGEEEFNRAAVSNGMYYVEDWQAGSQIVLAKNPYFQTSNPNVENKGVGNFDKIIVRFIPDEFTRVSELESGNVDIIWDVPTGSVKDVEANDDLQTFYYKQAGVSYAMFNTEAGALKDIKVREAINIGIDRDHIAKVLNNVVTPEYGYISEAQAGYSKEYAEKLEKEYAYNPDKAKALLKEAGYEDKDGDGILEKDGKKLSIEYCAATDNATSKATAPIIQEQLKALGIDLTIKEYEGAYIKQLQRDSKFEMAARRYVWNDADILYYVFTEASGYPWHKAEVTEALEKARYTVDPEERVKAYEKFHDELFKEMPAVSLFADNYCIATTSEVKGFKVTSDGRPIFNDVTK